MWDQRTIVRCHHTNGKVCELLHDRTTKEPVECDGYSLSCGAYIPDDNEDPPHMKPVAK